jgi:hypothetical protein
MEECKKEERENMRMEEMKKRWNGGCKKEERKNVRMEK